MGLFLKAVCIMLTLPLWYSCVLRVEAAGAVWSRVYSPPGGLSVPAAVVTAPRDLNYMMSNDRLPGVAIIGVRVEYGALLGYGVESGWVFGPLFDVMQTLGGRVIPAFYINDEEAATLLAYFLTANGWHDVNVISGNPALVYRVRRGAPMSRGIIDFRGENRRYNRHCYVRDTNAHLARVALLDAETATPELIRYIRRLGVMVWVEDNIAQNRPVALHTFLQKGMDGIVSGTYFTDLYDVFAVYTGDNSLIRHPFVIGHRGHPSMAPENTMAGFRSAAAHGADKIEADLMVTADNHLILAHDLDVFPLTSGFNPQQRSDRRPEVNVQKHTLEHLQRLRMTGSYLNIHNIPQYVFPDSNERIPTVYDILEFVVANNIVAVLEFKDFWPTSPRLLIDAINTTGAHEHVIVAAYVPCGNNLLNEVFAELPGISLKGFMMGMDGYFIDRHRPEESLGSMKSITQRGNRIISVNNHQPEESPTLIDRHFMRAANNRGLPIVPWTFGSCAQILANAYQNGVTGLITGSVHLLENAAIRLNPRNSAYFIHPGGTLTISAAINTRTQTGIAVTPEVVILSGGDFIRVNGNRVFANSINRESAAYVMLRYHVNGIICSNDDVYWNYTIYSAPIRVTVQPL